MQHAPVFNIDQASFWTNPYPVLEVMRRTAPIAWVPQFEAILITRHADITACDGLCRNILLAMYCSKLKTKSFFMFSSANRDEAVFNNPDAFDITRNTRAHIAFGVGPHFCIGAAASKSLIADVALPSILNHFPDLAIDPSQPIREGGWAFRGLLNLPIIW